MGMRMTGGDIADRSDCESVQKIEKMIEQPFCEVWIEGRYQHHY